MLPSRDLLIVPTTRARTKATKRKPNCFDQVAKVTEEEEKATLQAIHAALPPHCPINLGSDQDDEITDGVPSKKCIASMTL